MSEVTFYTDLDVEVVRARLSGVILTGLIAVDPADEFIGMSTAIDTYNDGPSRQELESLLGVKLHVPDELSFMPEWASLERLVLAK
ncbi:MAG: hypothetical protein FWD75_11390 [Propionibacteriaceae bacterium]|nr:hypothetical protein [Propionibacteriaceae bacterium]